MTSHVCSVYGTRENRRGRCLEESEAFLKSGGRLTFDSSVLIIAGREQGAEWKELEREGQFATKSLWKALECPAQDGRTERILVVQDHAAVWRIHSQWLEDDDEQKIKRCPKASR